MNPLKKPDVATNEASGLPNKTKSNYTKKIKPNTKIHRVLTALAEGDSYNRFEAARDLHDWCIHSTVSSIQNLGIQVHRERESVPCVNGTKTTDVMRYRLLPDQIEKAQKLLGDVV